MIRPLQRKQTTRREALIRRHHHVLVVLSFHPFTREPFFLSVTL